MRFVYLDEAGISNNGSENTAVVAGCVINMDTHWGRLKERFQHLVELYVPVESRAGFVFHAKDIWHGAKVFDRSSYGLDRKQVLHDLCRLISEMDFGVIYGFARKDELATTLSMIGERHDPKLLGSVAYMAAFVEAVDQSNKWMSRFATNEFCNIVIEDNAELRRFGKVVFSELRSGNVPPGVRDVLPGLPFRQVIDEPSYMRKAGAPALQLADICAFLIRRWLDGKSDVDEFLDHFRPSLVTSRVSPDQLKAIRNSAPGQID